MKEVSRGELGDVVRQARLEQGWSLRRTAQAAGVPHNWLDRVEKGHYNRPAPHRLSRLAEILPIDVERLNQLTGGSLADGLPDARVYFRTKYNLTTKEAADLEAILSRVRHERDQEHRQV